ncbi:hypothetical protein EV659_107137 [Rhodothalassium salexigens DSM 2132]|uniref:N(4)-bis(aminopropyl)spermidine synthase C-terminal domain-containing protein n=1 Tax=Rhodothalassium salexigens DSM 2132 TaxID=1188247 RepID=A0A4R2PHU4_RHOSA|nr:bis-aminopropyl spermidine synthase family protein [Rhodothalassium salexigens]MBB4211891.1 hypothetical protein [Rhodothalassium salexigens DSM 2132]MBK1638932.1 hypothetical protein [Rhodothalassium salexigens DSM 2132]TCP33525.1 hypothetical protein EV659_107137 [Rhodothalassium salexigens DSM 2132]
MTPSDPADKDVLARVATATNLREGAEGVATFLRAVKREGPAALNQIARAARLPVPVASALRRELETEGLLTRRGGVGLSEAGGRFVAETLGLGDALAPHCEACGGTGLAGPDARLVDRLSALLANAPKVDVTLDQAPCTAATALRRALLMLETGALEGRRILVLGDDDSVSLALCLVAEAAGLPPLPAPITVLEVDADWAAYLEAAAGEIGADLRVIRHDLREPLPADLRQAFDVIETDPPYTLEGARLFLARAAQALVPDTGTLGFLSFGAQAPAWQARLLAAVAEAGFAVTGLYPGFNRYQGAGLLGSTGQMLTLAGTGAADRPAGEDQTEAETSTPDAEARYAGPLYTFDVNPRARRYRCAGCGVVHSLGEDGVPATIEALKAGGCPACGATLFKRQSGDRG